jgi:glycogen synthase
MKIMIISNLYPPDVLGGYEILCEQVALQLEQKGHEIQVLTSDHGSSDSCEQITRTLKVYRPFSEKADFERANRSRTATYNFSVTAEAVRKTAPDVIFIWSLLRLTPGPARAAEASGIPVFYTFNDENIAGFAANRFSLKPRALFHWFMDRFITPEITLSDIRFTHTTCISRITRENIIARGVPIHDAKVIYQGIPISRFPIRTEEPGMLHEPVRLLYAGQLHRYKGVHTIIEALGILSTQKGFPPVELTIAGTGPEDYLQELHAAALQAGITPKFAGRIAHDQMPGTYRVHDLFIFPSIWQEPFGLTHLEAMASGLPVISTTNGGQGEFLEDRKNCLSFTPGDPADLADKLGSMLSDHRLRAALASEGRATVERSFTYTRYVDELEAELLRIAGEDAHVTR